MSKDPTMRELTILPASNVAERFAEDSAALVRFRVSGVLTEVEANRASKRLMNKLTEALLAESSGGDER